MKQLVFILIFLLFLIEGVSSSNVGIGEVHVFVINNPPVVTNVEIPVAYEDMALNCEVDFEDELKDINLDYKWYKNGFLIYDKGNVLPSSYFDKEDIIICEVVPYDFVQYGESKTVSVKIKPSPFLSQVLLWAFGE